MKNIKSKTKPIKTGEESGTTYEEFQARRSENDK